MARGSMVVKMVSVPKGRHVHTTFFMGFENETLASVGKLTQTVGEWQHFGAAVLLGADQMKGRLKVICVGDPKVVDHFSKDEG